MRRCACSHERVRVSVYLADMPVADSAVEVHCIIAQLFLQRSNQGMSFIITNVARAIITHTPIPNADQIAAECDVRGQETDPEAGRL